MSKPPLSIAFLGATGAVGTQCVKQLVRFPELKRLLLIGRRPLENVQHSAIEQLTVNVQDADSYATVLKGCHTAICTLGVGQPSKVDKSTFVKIDKLTVLEFAQACKAAGVKHFELLALVGISENSSTFYLRIKGELVMELKALEFDRLSIFKPSMILTPTNRYGFGQGVLLAVWPVLSTVLIGKLKQYRGIKVEELGRAMALNTLQAKSGFEELTWEEMQVLNTHQQ